MLEIGRAIVSLDILDKHFLCDLLKCKGACCVEGDSGAPLTDEEAIEIEQNYPVFEKYIPENHKKEVDKQGFSVIDSDGDRVTPLVNNRQCAYTFTDEKGILKCAIEKAYFNGEITFRKPLSCHLFPIRINEYRHFDAVNYQKLDICKPGRECGASEKLPLYKFLREPLIRRYGSEWYEQLVYAADNLKLER
ncbi:MAG: hypothetical protein A2W90_08300 [Bacteroidetes bacterium GWF2_42_66]|nr:MAG: hypothetical protein A2W89_05960 [Bacteroidetes bacterium GWE2_42_39]OFY40894.1 MAG: hypothetical protein A2W90_08300 [Bacteroidetes bacterium GWF2_42_66]HBL76325.1 DUF3109 domain-containing protein [Prolixibacteraceae bacterium]HCU63635.1 DUF3109 domain-containing protein [Prolixibacteraceae bacterium]